MTFFNETQLQEQAVLLRKNISKETGITDNTKIEMIAGIHTIKTFLTIIETNIIYGGEEGIISSLQLLSEGIPYEYNNLTLLFDKYLRSKEIGNKNANEKEYANERD